MHEMPLVIFTVLEQVAIGSLITLLVFSFMKKIASSSTLFKGALIVAIVAIVGMLASLLHLGQPMRAVNAVSGFGTSWLSREIVFFGGFVLFTILYAVAAKLDKDAMGKAFGAIAAVLGVLALVSTCMCYLMPGVPAWNTLATPLQFVVVVAAAGFLFAKALVATFDKAEKKTLWWLVFALVVLVAFGSRYLFFSDITVLVDLV